MHFFSKLGLAWLVLCAVSGARAEVQFEQPRVWKRAKPLPMSQQVWGFQSSYQSSSQKFDTNGASQALGQSYSRAISWKQVLNAEATAQGRAEMESYMRTHGAREQDTAALAEYKVDRQDIGFRLNWAYGLMKRWMIGFDVPLTYRRTRVDTKVKVLSQGRADLAQKVRLASEQELAGSGYDDIPEESSSWDWGDVSLMSQIAAFEKYRWQWSLQQVIRFPTARNPDLDSYIQRNDDSGQVDLGMNSLLDYKMRRWTLGGHLGYVVQMPDSVRSRVSSSSEARRVDPKVARDLGDYYWVAADGEWSMSPRLNFNLEYSYLRKYTDKYTGSSSDGLNYASFGKNTDQQLHQTRLGLQYRIVSEGARGGVDNKWVAQVGYTHPWIGRNSMNVSRASIDLISYF
jgi:hypothetical protein